MSQLLHGAMRMTLCTKMAKQPLTHLDNYNTLLACDQIVLIVQAIAVCHASNTVHGDIKPANFLLKNSLKKGSAAAIEQAAGNGPWVKSIDFGCSQVVSPDKPLTKR